MMRPFAYCEYTETGNWYRNIAKTRRVGAGKHISLFEAIFEFELMQRVTPKAYDALQKFGRWIVELNDQSLRSDPETAVRSLLSSLHYEEYLYEYATSPKAAEMQSKNGQPYLAGLRRCSKAMR